MLFALFSWTRIKLKHTKVSIKVQAKRSAPAVQVKYYSRFPLNKEFNASSAYSPKIQKAIRASLSGHYFANTRIPQIFHHSWKTGREAQMSLEVRDNLASFRELNTFAVQIIWDDNDIQEFVQTFYPNIAEFFNTLPKPVLKADVFRYMVLATFGGVYSDMDTECLKPADSWVPANIAIDVIIGIESDTDTPEKWGYVRSLQFVQWTLASERGSPLLCDAVLTTLRKLEETLRPGLSNRDILELTGPGMWTDVVNKHLNGLGRDWADFRMLKDARVFNGTMILPIAGFSPRKPFDGCPTAEERSSAKAFVEHKWWSSWK